MFWKVMHFITLNFDRTPLSLRHCGRGRCHFLDTPVWNPRKETASLATVSNGQTFSASRSACVVGVLLVEFTRHLYTYASYAHMVHCIMHWTVLSVFALCITSTMMFNQTDSPSGVNNTSVNVTEEPDPYSMPTQSDFFETTTEQFFTETTSFITDVTDSTPRASTFTDASTTESATSNTPVLPTVPTGRSTFAPLWAMKQYWL